LKLDFGNRRESCSLEPEFHGLNGGERAKRGAGISCGDWRWTQLHRFRARGWSWPQIGEVEGFQLKTGLGLSRLYGRFGLLHGNRGPIGGHQQFALRRGTKQGC
jgi:hypothetical protein